MTISNVVPLRNRPTGPTPAVAESDNWWHDCAQRALIWWARSGVPFDAHDLTVLGVPDPDDPHRWGALFAAARATGIIRRVGYHASARPSRGRGVCALWVGVKPEEAVAA